MAPAIFLWADAHGSEFGRDELLRMWFMVATIVVGLVAFSPLLGRTPRRGAFAFVAIGPPLWAALRYTQRDTERRSWLDSTFAAVAACPH